MGRPRTFEAETVVDRAMRRYWRTGYEATSIQDLVEATGLNRGSLYGAFGGKHALLLATLDRYRRAVVGPWLATLDDSGAGANQLRRFLATLAASATADPERRGCLLVNMAVERAAEDPAVGERVRDYLAGLEDGFARALRRPPPAGGREPDGRAAAKLLVAAVLGMLVLARLGANRDELGAVAGAALDAVEHSVEDVE